MRDSSTFNIVQLYRDGYTRRQFICSLFVPLANPRCIKEIYSSLEYSFPDNFCCYYCSCCDFQLGLQEYSKETNGR